MSGAKATRTTAATIGPDLHEDAAGPPRAPAALGRWGRALARRRRLVAALWLALAAGSAALLPGLTGRLTPPSLEVPGSPSAVAAAVIARGFPGQGTEQVLLAFSSPTLAAREPLYQRTVAAVARALDARPDVGALLPLPPVGGQAERHAYVLAGVLGDEPARQRNLPGQLADARRAALQASGGAVGVTILGVSRAFAQLAHTDLADLRETESRTVPLAGLLLVLGLGALGAAAVPLLVGGAAILTALGALALASRFWPVDSTVLTYTVTMAVGLGLDYTLIILLRYRQARHAGRPPVTAAAHATATAGGTVAWCALAILVTSAALLVVGVPWARSMALAGMLAAGVTAPAALTLAPALLPLLDRRLGWGTLPWRRPGRERSPAWTRGAAHLMRHPVRYATAAVVLLLLAAAPVLHLRTGLHYDRDTLSGTDMGGGLAQLERDGLAGLTSLALPHPPGTPPVDTTALAAALRADPRVSLVSAFDNGRDLTLMLVADRFAPDGEQAAAFQRDLRALAARLLPPGQRVHAVGPAARLADLSAAALTGLWRVLPVVLPASFVLLLVTFRSLLIPLKAVAMNLLCVGATFGLLTLAFQDTGRTPDVNVLLPLVIFTLVFGLSLDYEVFLVHRVHEHYRRTGDNTAAVLHGLRHTARPVTLAAAIMAVTFAGLMFTRRADFQQGGFAVAVAIVLDATLIRMVLVPALMRLLGRHNWWLPGAQRRRNAAISGTSRSWASSST
ncbi:Membrane protein YdfJ [Nonomuraea coxensis DSM 45129]|uniref:Membrane protein YdfJ n=1 Tax=Nonomuraea coxensis DSM 45129 TaxID=1122611 RepID=A0ABX8U0F4_9ACTN|nr:MMPL family transporter [Nonomuraea coxensis]QYC40108.1 Membrane protein YdfJ [Nonomuraea coxensis DSM 45129]